MMGKSFLRLTFVTFVVALLIGSANASALDVNVSTSPAAIVPYETVTITATTNMNGKGIVFVIQPAAGSSSASSLLIDVQYLLNKISSDPDASLWKIVSYAKVEILNPEGGKQEFTFPDDFKGLNGEPSTGVPGRYIVFFVFANIFVCKIGFDCAIFLVMPEFPLGTLMATTATFGALLAYAPIKRLRIKR
jgi:hypothetical protein